MAKDWVQTAADIEEALFGVQVAAAVFGRESEKATDLVTELAETGLIQFKDAAESVRNLMMTGLGMEEVTEVMWNLLSMSALYTAAGKDLGESIRKTSEATLIGTGLMRSDLMMRNLLNKMNKEANKTYDETWASMSSVQRAQLLYNETQKMSIRIGELWRGEAALMAGQIYGLQTNIQLTKRAMGDALRPVLLLTADLMKKLRGLIEAVTGKFGALISVVTILGSAFGVLAGGLLVFGGVALSVVKIFSGLRATGLASIGMLKIFSLAGWQVILVLGAIAAAIAVATYAYLKFTGRLDAWKNSAKATAEQTDFLREKLEELGAITEEISDKDDYEDRSIAHERMVADIEEDLEREVSKGLWANQMSIKDLEKRLSRENEDWDRYLGKREKQTGEESGMFGGLKSELDKLGLKVDEETKKIVGFFNRLKDPEMWAGIRNSILGFVDGIKEIVSDKVFWIEFGRELARNMGKIIIGIGDVIKAAFEGLFGGVMRGIATVTALTFVTLFGAALLKGFSAGGFGFAAATSAGLTVKAALLAVLPATIAIPLVLISGAALWNAIKFRGEIDSLWESVGKGEEMANRVMNTYIRRFKEGQITAEEFKTKTDALYESSQQVIISAEEARYSLGNLWDNLKRGYSNLFSNFQFGGIVPGKIGQPVPIMAHGGERIVPSREPAQGNITVNINNPVVREQQDIQRIADAVKTVLGQRQRWARMGSFS